MTARPAVCLAVLAGACAALAAEAPQPLRLVTWNVLHGGVTSARVGDGQRLEERLRLAVADLRALDADVVALQEASIGDERGDVAARIAAALGYRHARASAGWRWVGRLANAVLDFEEGPAILSRYPLGPPEVMRIEGCGLGYGRVLVCTRIDTPGGPLDACSTHPSHSDCQLHSIATLLAARRRDAALVVMGDLNATESDEGLAHLRATLGLTDTFRQANPTADGFTVWQPVDDPTPRARRRVDFVLVAPAPGATLRVDASRVVFDRADVAGDGTPLWASDHYGVLSVVDPFVRPAVGAAPPRR